MCLVAFSEENQRRGEGLCLTCERLLSLGRELAASLRQGTEAKPMVVVGGDPRPSTDMLLSALTAGLFWGWLYWKTGSLVPCILSHAFWTVAVFILWPLTPGV